MSFVFQTPDVNRSERLDYWQEMVSAHHVPVASLMLGGECDGRMQIDDWGGLQISETEFSPIVYSHGAAEMRRSERDDFICVLNIGEDGAFCNNVGEFEFRAGDLFLYDTDQIYSVQFPTQCRTISLRIPRPLMVSRLHEADRQFALKMDGARPMAQLAGSLFRTSVVLRSQPDEVRRKEAEAPMLDVLMLAVREAAGEDLRASPGQATLLARVKADLMARLGDHDLTVEQIAEAQGISARTLNRLFASEGTTLMRWLWKQRLASGYRALSEGSVRQVTEVAFAIGFKDSSHFTRAFKRAYGVPPSTLLSR